MIASATLGQWRRVCRSICGGCEIERRPRGASRLKPLVGRGTPPNVGVALATNTVVATTVNTQKTLASRPGPFAGEPAPTSGGAPPFNVGVALATNTVVAATVNTQEILASRPGPFAGEPARLFRASIACARRARPPCFYDAISWWAPGRSRANSTGITGPKQTERAKHHHAPRGRRSISHALKRPRRALPTAPTRFTRLRVATPSTPWSAPSPRRCCRTAGAGPCAVRAGQCRSGSSSDRHPALSAA